MWFPRILWSYENTWFETNNNIYFLTRWRLTFSVNFFLLVRCRSYHAMVCTSMSNITFVICGQGSVYPSKAHAIIPNFLRRSCCAVFGFYVLDFVYFVCVSVWVFLLVALSVYFRFMSVNVLLVSFASLLQNISSVWLLRHIVQS